MPQFIIGIALIIFAAIALFFGQQLAREGWTKIFASSTTQEKSEVSTTQQSSGPNSPNISGSNNSVNINSGISEETMKELLRDKSVAANQELAARYPSGYVLFGVANGKIVYRPDFKTMDFKGDWDNATVTRNKETDTIQVYVPHVSITWGKSSMQFNEMRSTQRFVENEPINTRIFNIGGTRLFCEVLDATKGIYLLGFSTMNPKK